MNNILRLAIGGVTCGGKSTLAKKLSSYFAQKFPDQLEIHVINQDPHYLPQEKLTPLPQYNYHHWDEKSSVDFESLQSSLISKCEQFKNNVQNDNKCLIIIIEGNMIFESEHLVEYFDQVYFIKGEYKNIKAIRDSRIYEPPDPPGYFDGVAWPCYLEHEKSGLDLLRARNRRLPFETFLTLSSETWEKNFQAILKRVETSNQLANIFPRNLFEIGREKLDLHKALQFSMDDKFGAVVNFVGITRDNFDGKSVLGLEYECYEQMARRVLNDTCELMRLKINGVGKIAIFHRIGFVPLSEASLIVVVSATHRKEAFEGCQFLVDEIKRTVPIWKKEIYDGDNEATWK